MTCACKAHVSYEASGDTMKVVLDRMEWCPLHEAAGDLLAALTKFMGWLDEGLLVRDITKDHQSEWAIKMMHFVNDLNKAKAVIEKASAI